MFRPCMKHCQSFPPITTPHARVLILGSMPGVASLQAQQYYAHPQNQFWPIMGTLLGFDPQMSYPERCASLQASGIAVWDVLQSCERAGSLDADIAPHSKVANNFPAFFAAHPLIQRVCFNGATAEQIFRQQKMCLPELELIRLPSTSPAHAGMQREIKLAHWREAITQLAPISR